MYNFYVYAGQHGNITTGTLIVELLTVAKYLNSANNHNLMHLPIDVDRDG